MESNKMRIPLGDPKSVRHKFYHCKTAEEVEETYNHYKSFCDLSEKEAQTLTALYERRLWELKNPRLQLRGRARMKGQFVNGEEERW